MRDQSVVAVIPVKRMTVVCIAIHDSLKNDDVLPQVSLIATLISPSGTPASVAAISHPSASILARTNYPNPGYLGASSHAAIFSQLSEDEAPVNDPGLLVDNSTQSHALESPLGFESEVHVSNVAGCIENLLESFSAAAFKNLVSFWRATGANLALAGPLIDLCLDALDDLHSLSTQGRTDPYLSYVRLLLRNSSRPLPMQFPLTLDEFCSQSLGSNARLEILGLLICAVIRASSEIYPFPPLYLDGTRRQELLALAIKLTDAAVEAILSLDTLNDLQLVFQYENFISYSYVFGVQSYYSYRKLGDVITSIATLGYHEKLGAMNDLPEFLVKIRRTALARTYSADKNWSIFLGRPPRLGKKFCHLSAILREPVGTEQSSNSSFSHRHNILHWHSHSEMSVWAETRWTAACASLKEEILDIFSEDTRENVDERVRDLQQRAELQWAALPQSFRMEGSLKSYNRGAWERDFLVSTRLGYLHVLFLLRLLCLGSPASPETAFVTISQEILSLVVEVIVLRSQLVCSTGTSFEWRLAHYGLPAIGIIMIAMLRRQTRYDSLQDAQTIRDLGIIVTVVDLGTIVRPMEPNYALLSRAIDTIKKFLVRFNAQDRQSGLVQGLNVPGTIEGSLWGLQCQLEPWDFEIDFWDNLAEHPSMFSPEIEKSL
ncbi:Fungal transcriptional regulatory protein, N-terminal [Fusarium austroafricanum]|uniref:Fungal transcriptional regulatory protein, N-terminal n=1 Tax=Fusarium austroafricanum TaxID=2364996 RepID=A0A8H4NVW1_9HYPO|nr:Fungal transcriptional regulatory protein, N-terminal [Fusarium austroafricanum]